MRQVNGLYTGSEGTDGVTMHDLTLKILPRQRLCRLAVLAASVAGLPDTSDSIIPFVLIVIYLSFHLKMS